MRYAKIKHYDIANGEGIRISLFVSGCRFHCKDCFNEEAQDFNYGEKYTKETAAEIVKTLCSPRFDGLSLLGGDPLWQADSDLVDLIALADNVHAIGKDVWLWSGFTWEEIMNADASNKTNYWRKVLVSSCDVFVDGRFEAEKKDLRLKWRGSSNQRVIDVQETLKSGKITVLED